MLGDGEEKGKRWRRELRRDDLAYYNYAFLAKGERKEKGT